MSFEHLRVHAVFRKNGLSVPLDTWSVPWPKRADPPPPYFYTKQGACGFYLRARYAHFQLSVCWGLLLVKLSQNRIFRGNLYTLSCQNVFFHFTAQLYHQLHYSAHGPFQSHYPSRVSHVHLQEETGNGLLSSEMEMRPRAFKGTPLVNAKAGIQT